jgi:hypothetical protein
MGHKYAPLLEDDDGLTSVKRDLDAAGPAADMMSVTRTGKRANRQSLSRKRKAFELEAGIGHKCLVYEFVTIPSKGH